MIIKSYLLEKNISILENKSLTLFYGENLGLKDDIKKLIKDKYQDFKIINLHQEEILNDQEKFYNEINNISLFEDKKIYFIEQVSDKILEIVDYIEKKKNNERIFLFGGQLEKKSKLRSFFEKKDNYGLVACYFDNEITIRKIIVDYLKGFEGLSTQNINLIIENTNLDRTKLRNELDKISTFFQDKKLNYEKIEKLLNIKTSEDFNKLKNQAMLGNKTKTNNLLSNTIFEDEKNIYYLALINQRLNRLSELYFILENTNSSIEKSIENMKPQIFWKDKPDFIAQAKKWNKKKVKNMLNETYNLEIKLKKYSFSKNILLKKLMVDICNLANS